MDEVLGEPSREKHSISPTMFAAEDGAKGGEFTKNAARRVGLTSERRRRSMAMAATDALRGGGEGPPKSPPEEWGRKQGELGRDAVSGATGVVAGKEAPPSSGTADKGLRDVAMEVGEAVVTVAGGRGGTAGCTLRVTIGDTGSSKDSAGIAVGTPDRLPGEDAAELVPGKAGGANDPNSGERPGRSLGRDV